MVALLIGLAIASAFGHRVIRVDPVQCLDVAHAVCSLQVAAAELSAACVSGQHSEPATVDIAPGRYELHEPLQLVGTICRVYPDDRAALA